MIYNVFGGTLNGTQFRQSFGQYQIVLFEDASVLGRQLQLGGK